MPKISQRPAQSGADVADGDLIGIIDVGSPNLDERITVAEFAQAPQFSSRYKPLASDSLWIPADSFVAVDGASAIGTLGNASNAQRRFGVMLLDASVSETIQTSAVTPPGWTTFDLYVWWANAGAGSGDIRIQFLCNLVEAGQTTDRTLVTGGLNSTTTITSAAQYVPTRTKATSTPITYGAGSLLTMWVVRRGDDAADTLANDIGIMGIELVRAS